jgi:hypothetical protein
MRMRWIDGGALLGDLAVLSTWGYIGCSVYLLVGEESEGGCCIHSPLGGGKNEDLPPLSSTPRKLRLVTILVAIVW